MKKVSALFLALMVVSAGAQADALGSAVDVAGKVFNKTASINAGVGFVTDNANIEAEADAQNGGLANAGGVVASQKAGQSTVGVNVGLGVFTGGTVKAKAKASGKDSVANAGGVVAAQY
ncbi:hypothetical protein [Neisseria wadsworthii]|uniref:hypothetical protein n=1 Tax=Neisseria wadsworthii TaxID=607711 RepID=UPI000D304AD8|nr:hypothetical protein [Neisseria wadsworthii]